jgi:deoxycytidylate deaminase
MNLKFFDLAKKVSKLSNHKHHKIGSVIVRGGKVISVGTNKIKTHPRSPHPHFSLHSEMAAILLAKQDLKDCDLYVFRELKDGTLAISRPCEYCWQLINASGIKEVHYTVDKGHETEYIDA